MPALLIIITAAFMHSLVGFGFALFSMPLLVSILPVDKSAALVALVGISLRLLLLIRYRRALTLRDIWPLVAAAAVGIPLGVLLLNAVDEHLVRLMLGLVVIGYVLLNLSHFNMPAFKHPLWAYGAGFASGILTGAYNIAAPPFIMYAYGRGWDVAKFKSNFQAFTMFTAIMVVLTHWASGNYTEDILTIFVFAFPLVIVAFLFGTTIERYIKPKRFRQLVLIALLLMGVKLLF